ncbi:MAG: ammonia-forming cytochrome c nitrite reductase subunit c552 [Betaproteobacteria bacterium]|nr:ammonia-forming cytochrome c nitrite reductase subunit c552 [Betaproteobacteria bacterium]
MSNLAETIKRNPAVGWLILLLVMAIVILAALIFSGITEKSAQTASLFNNVRKPIESIAPSFTNAQAPSKEYERKKVEIVKTTPAINAHNDEWGVNFPREYDTWKKTRETDFKSKHLGNAPDDVLKDRPNMVVLWAGYAFSRDYSAPRGHWYTLYDMRATLRVGAPGVEKTNELQPGTCWTCKSPDVPRIMQEKTPGVYYSAHWSEWGPEIVNPLGCADCHDPKTMNLNISRPALAEAFRRAPEYNKAMEEDNPNLVQFLKRIREAGNDVNKATPNDKRTLVCAQCHVEYYFGEGKGKYLTFPWDRGLTVEDAERYYDNPIFTSVTPSSKGELVDNQPFSDWIHGMSKAPMLKAQHPDFEIFMLGTHGKRGVSCADCHLPYKAEGGIKYTDHQIMSPLKNIAGTCQNCHRDSEERLRSYVYDNQDKVLEIRDRVEKELAKAHIMTKALLDSGKVTVESDEIKPVHKLLREASWRWDYGVASHGGSFHAPVEIARILSHALDKSLLAQIEVQKLLTKHDVAVTFPDLDHWTKEDAQKYVGLNMEKLNAEKQEFLKTVVPGWIKDAADKGKLTDPELVNQYK